ncbi:MAG: hypothetical protein VZR02_03550 [Lachnospiraceae bacterium]|nr:hypothetical protein [Lachnospiraceae bacterium]
MSDQNKKDQHLPSEMGNELFAPPENDFGHKMGFILSIPAALVTAFLMLACIVGIGIGGGSVAVIMTVFNAVLTVTFAALGVQQKRISDSLQDYPAYVRYLLKSPEATVRKLAIVANTTEAKARWELEYLVKRGFFREGHLVDNQTLFLVTEKAYAEHQQLRLSGKSAKQVETKKEGEDNRKFNPEVAEMLNKGQDYLTLIRQAETATEDTDTKKQFTDLFDITRRIFSEVWEHPDKAGKISLLDSYYIPTTSKIFKTYVGFGQETGDQVNETRAEVAGFLPTITEAYKNVYDSLFTEEAIDISSDISVMKTMMKQDGLIDDDFGTQKGSSHGSSQENKT